MLAGLPRLPVWIVTGFLGSGKTTLVNHLVRQSRRLLVIQHLGRTLGHFGFFGVKRIIIIHEHFSGDLR